LWIWGGVGSVNDPIIKSDEANGGLIVLELGGDDLLDRDEDFVFLAAYGAPGALAQCCA
jgi:hypothetical protein